MLRTQRLILLAAVGLGLAACQERLAAPADCPNLCPGGYTLKEDTLFALPGGDSSYVGYLEAGQGSSLRVSYQFPLSEDRAVYRFARRTDSLLVNGTYRHYAIDSVALELSLGYRDSTVKGLKIYLFRMPAKVDSSVTFTQVDTAFTPANTVDSFVVADSLVSGRLRVVLDSTTVANRLVIPDADSGVLALGVQIRANQGTGVRIGAASAGSGAPSFINYVTVPSSDTSTVARTITPGLQFNTYVSQTPETVDPTVLTVGGTPSTRSLVRFPWPAFLKDSATLVRATLQLFSTGTVQGLGEDSAFVRVQPVIADFGGKSPSSSDANVAVTVPVLPGPLDTLGFEIRRTLTLWQGSNPLPPALMLQLIPEVSSFTRPTFNSTRTPARAPRIIVTYAVKFPFGEP